MKYICNTVLGCSCRALVFVCLWSVEAAEVAVVMSVHEVTWLMRHTSCSRSIPVEMIRWMPPNSLSLSMTFLAKVYNLDIDLAVHYLEFKSPINTVSWSDQLKTFSLQLTNNLCAQTFVVFVYNMGASFMNFMFFWRPANHISDVLLNIIFLFFGKIKWWWWWWLTTG